MGRFVIEIVAVGGHGCQREIDNAEVTGCGFQSCPDCAARQFVKRLKNENHCNVELAVITHWPAKQGEPPKPMHETDPGSVRDDLLTKQRSGSFKAPR